MSLRACDRLSVSWVRLLRAMGTKRECGESQSLIDEIRAQDIYTLHYPDKGPTLPSVASLYGCETLISRETVLRKSNQKCRGVIKKLSVHHMKRSLSNLPALIEEDLSYQPSVPMCAEAFYDEDFEPPFSVPVGSCCEARGIAMGEDNERTSSIGDESDESSLEILDDDGKYTTDQIYSTIIRLKLFLRGLNLIVSLSSVYYACY